MSDATAGGQESGDSGGVDSGTLLGGGEGQGDAGQNWRDSLPDEIKGNASLSKFADPSGLAKSYLELEGKLGAPADNILKIPTGDEPMDPVWDRLGRPEDKDGYEIPKVAGIENTPEERLGEFKEVAHKLGLSAKQFTKILEWSVDSENRLIAAADATSKIEHEKLEAAMKTEWGAAFDEKKALAQRAVDALGGEELKTFMNNAAIGDSPVLVKAFAQVGAMMAEDTGTFPGFAGGEFSGLTAQDARQKALDMQNDSETGAILRKPSHPLFVETQAKHMQYWGIYNARKAQ